MGSCENTALVNEPLHEAAAIEQHLCSEAMEILVTEERDCLFIHSNGDCAVKSGEYEITGCERSSNICCRDVIKGNGENMVDSGLKELIDAECGGSMVCLKQNQNENVNISCLKESIDNICGEGVVCLVNQAECVNDSSSKELKGGSYDDRVVCLEENQGESVVDSCLKEMMGNRCRNSVVYSNGNQDESLDGSFLEEFMGDKCGDTTISSNENRGANADGTDSKELIGDKYGDSLVCMNAYLSQNVDVSGSKEMMGDRSGDGASCLNNDNGENANGSGAEELIDSGDKTNYSNENQFQIGNLSGLKEFLGDGVGDHVVCLNENQGNIDVEDSETYKLGLKNRVASGEDSPTSIGRSLGLSQDENTTCISGGMEISTDFIDEMKGNDEIAVGLIVKENVNELGGACLSENQGKVDHFNSEKDASQEVEMSAKPKRLTTLVGNCVEHDKHKDHDGVSGSTLRGVIEEFCNQKSSVQSCKLASESAAITVFRSDCHHQTDLKDANNVRDPILDGKSSPSSSMSETDTCRQISASCSAHKHSSFQHTGCSVISGDFHNLKDDPSNSDLSLESFTKPVETKSKDDICIELLASESCLSTLEMLHGTQSLGTGLNTQVDDKNVNCPLGDNVAEVSERTDVTAGKKAETSSKIITVEENACNLKGNPFELGANCLGDISASLSCQPFLVVDNDLSKRVGSPALLAKDDCAVNSSSSSIDCSGQREAEQRDAVKVNCVSESKHHPITSSSSQRGSRKSKSSRKTSAKKVARNCRKTKLTQKHESLEFIFKVSRRKRSYLSKPARSLVWGLFSNIPKLLDQHRDPGCNEEQKQEPAEAGVGQACERRSKNRSVKRIKGSRGVSSASTSCLRLRIKVGKEVPSNLTTMVAEAVDLPVAVNTSFSNHGKETSFQCPKFSEIVEGKVGELGNERLFQSNESLGKVNKCPDAPIMDLKLENKIVGSVRNLDKPTEDAADNYIVSPSDVVPEGGEAVENKYMDPGTSPDSEVINLIPDTQFVSTQQEVSPNTVLDTSGVHASAIVKSCKSNKQGKKDNRKSPGAARRKSKSSKNSGRKQKSNNNEVCSSEAHALSTEANSSGETKLGVSEEVMKVDIDVGAKAFCPDDPDIKHAKSSSSSKGKQNQGTKSSKSQVVSKGKSRVSNSARSKKGNACKPRLNDMKSVRKGKVKEKGSDEEAVAKGERDSQTGNHMSAEIENSNTGNIIASADMINTNLASAGAMEQSNRPDNAWVRCDDCYKWRRIPVALVQSVDNASRWICGDNVDKAFADCSIPQEMSNADINAELGYSDAEDDACDGFNYKELEKGIENKCVTVSPTSHFWRIASNQFLHRGRKTQTIDEIMVCYCKSPPDGKLGCGDACLNRLLNIECVKGTCPCGDLCSNQQFQKRKYPKMKWDKCGKKGFGLRMLENISAGQFLIEYVGEVLDMQAYKARQKEYASRGQRHFYFMTLNGSEVIDACVKGNYGRFINHSCDPNCRTEKWMVNGEICIGLFALRDIRKGEELTFDYNYVRVFGAAAKKCHCGSPNCRGYIGGDPLSAEVTVHDDSDEEYPEPLMLEEGQTWKGSDNLISRSCSFDDREIRSVERVVIDGEVKLENMPEPEDSGNRAASAMSHLNCSVETEDLRGNFQSSIQSEEPVPVLCEATAAIQLDNSTDKKASIQKLDTSPNIFDNKLPSDSADDHKKSKYDSTEDKQILPKSRPLMKTSRSSSSVKKEKISSNSLSDSKVHITFNKSPVPSVKPKKLLENSSNCRFEAVEEKLNELLDSDGGITKRKDASKGYLKLLLLTATSGDGGGGEAIQSNRDLSMILDALLKTKSRVVLTDIINKNGLQMLHNIMKKYRSDFKKIPILRKLLKVLDHLASREILTLEHINGGPPCAGRESFRVSMLSLTEHEDKQVHQIARNFRDRWIPKPVRKHGYRDKDEARKEFHRGLDCNRVSTSLNRLHDQAIRPAEAVSSAIQSVDTAAHEGGSLSSAGDCQIGGTKIRKRKSRWDQPAEEKDVSRSPKKLEYSSLSIVVDSAADQESMSRGDKKCQDHVCEGEAINNSNDDVPPGFSSLISSTAPCSADSPQAKFCQLKCPDVILAHPQKKFISRLPVSYGIPLPILHQFGSLLGECAESWVIAPGMPFRPFPPLPPYPRDQKEPPMACTANYIGIKKDAEGQQVRHRPAISCQDESISSTPGVKQPDMDIPATNILQTYKRTRESNDLGKKYFRQQKRKVAWHKSECMESNNLGETCHIDVGNVKNEIRNCYSSDDMTCRDEKRSQ